MKKSKLLILSLLAVSAIGLTSCGQVGPQGEKGDPGAPGEKGETGAPGKDGTNGSDGKNVLNGNEAPKDTLGVDGDSYIDYSTFDYYVKENGKWFKKGNIKGEKGNDGEQGPKGDTGAKGEKGDTGSSGSTGSKGDKGATAWSNTILPSQFGYIVPDVGSAIEGTQLTFKMYPKSADYKCISLKLNETVISADKLSESQDGTYRYYTGDETKMPKGGFVVSADFSNAKNSVTLKSVTGGSVSLVDGASTTYFEGETVKLKITPSEGYKFTGLKLNNVAIADLDKAKLSEDGTYYTYETKMSEKALEVEGVFTQGYEVEITQPLVGATISTSLDKEKYAIPGTEITITVKVIDTSILKAIKVNGAKVGDDLSNNTKKGGTYTTTYEMGSEKITISAELENLESVTINKFTGGTIVASPDKAYPDTNIKLTITPAEGNYLYSLSIGGQVKSDLAFEAESIGSNVLTCTIPMVKGGLEIGATFGNDSTSSVARTFLIHGKDDLVKFRDEINAGSKVYSGGKANIKLADDFGDKNGVLDLQGKTWIPINTQNCVSIIFDGNNKTISNFVIKEEKERSTGFFGVAYCCTIKNLKLTKANVTGINAVAVLAGFGECAHILDCEVSDSTVYANSSIKTEDGDYNGDKVGAIVGRLIADGGPASIERCKVSGEITLKGYRDVGPIAGYVGRDAGTPAEKRIATLIENKVSGRISLINDRSNDYKKDYGNDYSKFDIGEICGEVYDKNILGSTNTTDATYTKTIEYMKGFSADYSDKHKYYISSVDGFKYFRDSINSNTKWTESWTNPTIELQTNINLGGEEWEPINSNTGDRWFTFDGKGHTIENFKVTRKNQYGAGLFSYLKGCSVYNLNINKATICALENAGALAAYCYGGTIQNVNVTNSSVTVEAINNGTSYTGGVYAGGLVGGFLETSTETDTITQCSVTDTTITGYKCVGGIAGAATNFAPVQTKLPSIKDNTLTRVTLYKDNSHNYENLTKAEDYYFNKVLGANWILTDSGGKWIITVSNNKTDSVTITDKPNS